MQEQVAPLERRLQIGLQFAPFAQARAELRLEKTQRSAHFRFRLIERRVRVGDQRFHILAVAREDRHADAQPHLHLVAVDVEIVLEGPEQTVAKRASGRVRIVAGEHRDKLITADAREICSFRGYLQPPGGFAQQPSPTRCP